MTLKPKRILWPTDFSELALRAVPYARAYRDTFGSQLHVVHVCQPLSGTAEFTMGAYGALGITDADLLGAVNGQLRDLIRKQFPGNPVPVSEALVGSPWMRICEYAQTNDIDLIILTTHGRTGLSHAMIGSVAERVVQHAPCPVLVVKNEGRGFAAE